MTAALMLVGLVVVAIGVVIVRKIAKQRRITRAEGHLERRLDRQREWDDTHRRSGNTAASRKIVFKDRAKRD